MGYDDFKFGANVKDVPSYRAACMGLMVCPHCGRAVVCGDLELLPEGKEFHEPTQEELEMIRRDGASAGNRGTRKRTGFRYLSVDMLTAHHQLASIVDARMMPDNFKQGQECLVLKIKFKGEYLLWTLRDGNPSLDTLADALGDDETKWNGIEIELFIEEDEFTGKKWLRGDVAPKEEEQEQEPEPARAARSPKKK